MNPTGTHFNYYHVCHRKLWLSANSITMKHTSDLVSEGRLIHQESYPNRSARYEEVAIDGVKVDFYDPRASVIHEIKKSNKVGAAHLWQLKYYMYETVVKLQTTVLFYIICSRSAWLKQVWLGSTLTKSQFSMSCICRICSRSAVKASFIALTYSQILKFITLTLEVKRRLWSASHPETVLQRSQ